MSWNLKFDPAEAERINNMLSNLGNVFGNAARVIVEDFHSNFAFATDRIRYYNWLVSANRQATKRLNRETVKWMQRLDGGAGNRPKRNHPQRRHNRGRK